MGKVEIDNFCCLDHWRYLIFFSQICLLSSPQKVNFRKKVCFSRTISRLKVTYMFMTLATSLVVLFNCYAAADILMKLLQQCSLFFIVVVVIPGQ